MLYVVVRWREVQWHGIDFLIKHVDFFDWKQEVRDIDHMGKNIIKKMVIYINIIYIKHRNDNKFWMHSLHFAYLENKSTSYTFHLSTRTYILISPRQCLTILIQFGIYTRIYICHCVSPSAAFKSLRLLCRFWVLCWSHTICVFLFGWSFLCLSDAPFERTISHRARPLGERQEEATISADISTPTTRAAITLIESTSYSANIYAARLFMYMCDWTLWVYIVYTFSCGSFQSYIYIYIVIESTSPQSNKHTKNIYTRDTLCADFD